MVSANSESTVGRPRYKEGADRDPTVAFEEVKDGENRLVRLVGCASIERHEGLDVGWLTTRRGGHVEEGTDGCDDNWPEGDGLGGRRRKGGKVPVGEKCLELLDDDSGLGRKRRIQQLLV